MAISSEAFLEFGFCGVDKSASMEEWCSAFAAPTGEAGSLVRFVAAFQLAYQGFPWEPTDEYKEDAPAELVEGRRYGGLVYPAWYEVEKYMRELPNSTAFSFHLNETPTCPYVSGLLRGEPEYLKLVTHLVEEYRARHIQVNLTAHGVKTDLFEGDSPEAERSFSVLGDLCTRFPDTLFIVPIAEIQKKSSSGEAAGTVSTLPFFMKLLDRRPALHNLCGFFDSSAGKGIEPTSAPEIPEGYPSGPLHFVGYTGGIQADNVKAWLSRYSERARKHGCKLVSDAQSGFREDRNRGKPVSVHALQGLKQAVMEWAAEEAKDRDMKESTRAGDCTCLIS